MLSLSNSQTSTECELGKIAWSKSGTSAQPKTAMKDPSVYLNVTVGSKNVFDFSDDGTSVGQLGRHFASAHAPLRRSDE